MSRYDYTPDGKLATRTWARGIVTTYSYDDSGSMTNTVYSDGTPTISLAYNRAGRQIQAIDAAGVTTFLYDDFGVVTNETVVGVAGTNTIERFYDNFGRSLGYSLNGFRQSTLAYDPVTGRLVTMEVPVSDGSNNNSPTPNSNFFTWNYLDGSDLKSSLAYPNGLTASWTYDANGQLLQVKNAFPTNTISQYDYTCDAAGRRIQIARSGSAMSESRTDVYGYNARSELISASKLGGSQSSATEYAYFYDDIGNRETSSERGTNAVYAANNLNQYTSISNFESSAFFAAEFTPQFDDDGNQTRIKTATGIWSVTYNGENRPVHWSNGATNIVMSFDRMGRRVVKNDLRFVYDGYLQIANFEHSTSNVELQTFVWDPTGPTATRPLVWNRDTSAAYYTHDGNKNVSEVVAANGVITAHYEYAPFGAVLGMHGESASLNPWRFSCEYAEDDAAMVYYNYRHYESLMGRWISRDRLFDFDCYRFISNNLDSFDFLGDDNKNDPTWKKNPKLKDIKKVDEFGPIPSAYLKPVVSSEPSRADVFGRLDPPPPHKFDAESVCAHGRYNKVVLTFKLTLRMWYVPKEVKVKLPDGTEKARTAAGVARTILHEKEHAKHFSSTFEEIWNMAVTLRGGGDGIGEKKWADDKARKIKESIKSGKIYNKWKERVDEEDSHSGEGWDEWYKNNGPAFP